MLRDWYECGLRPRTLNSKYTCVCICVIQWCVCFNIPSIWWSCCQSQVKYNHPIQSLSSSTNNSALVDAKIIGENAEQILWTFLNHHALDHMCHINSLCDILRAIFCHMLGIVWPYHRVGDMCRIFNWFSKSNYIIISIIPIDSMEKHLPNYVVQS